MDKEKEKRLSFKPTRPSNGERCHSNVQGRYAKSDAVCYCASESECGVSRTCASDQRVRGENAEDMLQTPTSVTIIDPGYTAQHEAC